MFRNETSLLSEQLHRQYIRGYHNDHGNVKGDQRTEHEERSVVNHARPWSRHDIQGIYYTQNCDGTRDQHGEQPHGRDLEADHPLGGRVPCPQRVSDAQISAQRDEAHVHYARGTR